MPRPKALHAKRSRKQDLRPTHPEDNMRFVPDPDGSMMYVKTRFLSKKPLTPKSPDFSSER